MNRCLDLYEEYTPIQQRGPLIAYLILQGIQDSSKQALDMLKNQITKLDIKKLPSEDVYHVVGLVKSTYKVLKSSST